MLQLNTFFILSASLTLDRPTKFEYLCVQRPYQLHLVSSIYHILHKATLPKGILILICINENMYSSDLSPRNFGKRSASASAFKFSKCMVQRETALKILMFWYRTPEVVNHQDSSFSALCWHCGLEVGSQFHIFWQCPWIWPFWTDVMLLLQKSCLSRWILPLFIGSSFSLVLYNPLNGWFAISFWLPRESSLYVSCQLIDNPIFNSYNL